jgi:hypothetical protein
MQPLQQILRGEYRGDGRICIRFSNTVNTQTRPPTGFVFVVVRRNALLVLYHVLDHGDGNSRVMVLTVSVLIS